MKKILLLILMCVILVVGVMGCEDSSTETEAQEKASMAVENGSIEYTKIEECKIVGLKDKGEKEYITIYDKSSDILLDLWTHSDSLYSMQNKGNTITIIFNSNTGEISSITIFKKAIENGIVNSTEPEPETNVENNE